MQFGGNLMQNVTAQEVKIEAVLNAYAYYVLTAVLNID